MSSSTTVETKAVVMFMDHFHPILLKQLRVLDFPSSTNIPFFSNTPACFSLVVNILPCKPQSLAGIIFKLTSSGSTSAPRRSFIIPHNHCSIINNNDNNNNNNSSIITAAARKT